MLPHQFSPVGITCLSLDIYLMLIKSDNQETKKIKLLINDNYYRIAYAIVLTQLLVLHITILSAKTSKSPIVDIEKMAIFP